MKKILVAGLFASLAIGLAPVQADPTNGCVAGPGNTPDGISCTYTATGRGRYVAATPNHYTITVTHTNPDGSTTTTTPVDSDSLTFPTQGTFSASAGDLVTVTMGPDSAEVVEGAIGIVAAADES